MALPPAIEFVPCGDVFGELDTPESVKANVRAIRQILDQAGRRDYTVRVYPNGRHNRKKLPLTIRTTSSAKKVLLPLYLSVFANFFGN